MMLLYIGREASSTSDIRAAHGTNLVRTERHEVVPVHIVFRYNITQMLFKTNKQGSTLVCFPPGYLHMELKRALFECKNFSRFFKKISDDIPVHLASLKFLSKNC
jgi:hypothetical protein